MKDLPELHEGHAPITLHELFRAALDAYDDWDYGLSEPEVSFEGTHVPISAVFERMRLCSDILPHNLVGIITERLTKPWSSESPLDEMTVATAARVMGVMVRRRRMRQEETDIVAFLSRLGPNRGYSRGA